MGTCCSVTKLCLILQHARLPCPSPTPEPCSNSCSSSQWCHPTISSSVVPFSSCPQSFPAPGSFPMSWLFASGGQSIQSIVKTHLVAEASMRSQAAWESSFLLSVGDNVIDLVEITDILRVQQLTESVNGKRLSEINVGLLVPLNLPAQPVPWVPGCGSQDAGQHSVEQAHCPDDCQSRPASCPFPLRFMTLWFLFSQTSWFHSS